MAQLILLLLLQSKY